VIVDAQVHLWKAEAPDRPWPSWGRAARHLAEPLTYEKMLALMDEAGVDRAIIVPPSWEGDRNDYALEAAQKHPNRFAVMGRIALDDPRSRDLLPRWRATPGLLGIRVTFSYGKESWIDDGTVDWFWPAAEAAGVPIMIHPPNFIPSVARIAERHPGLKLIIDHFGLSREIARERKHAAAIARTASLARFPNVYVKTSSAVTYSHEPYPFRDMDPHIRTIVEAFGARRCFWGCDLSIAFGKCPYRQHVTHFTQELDFLSAADKKLIMGEAILECLGWRA
jgi:predicted TIM-barrel fold metal-dependent hydrolase